MINAANFKVSISYGFKMPMWASLAMSLFSCAAWAQTYPVSGVWVARDARFPSSTAGACLILKKFGLDGVLAQPFPNLMIFSKDRRFEVRGNHLAERDIRSVKRATDGGAVRNAVGIRCGASSGNMKVSFQAARSIG